MAIAHEVGPVGEIPPGERKIVAIRGIEIGVFNVDGEFHALPNLCIHQWGPLCAGKVTGTLDASPDTDWRYDWIREGDILVCPWHSMEFDLTTGQSLAYPKVRLRKYPIVVEDGIVKVML